MESWAFSSVMTTGNLGRFADALYARLRGRAEPAHHRQAWIFGIISVTFGAGAAIGAFVTTRFGSGALTVPILLLSWALVSVPQSSRQRAGRRGARTPDTPVIMICTPTQSSRNAERRMITLVPSTPTIRAMRATRA